MFALGEHHRAGEGDHPALDVVDAHLALGGLGSRGDEDVADGVDTHDGYIVPLGFVGAVPVMDPEGIRAEPEVSLGRDDVAVEDRDLIVLLELQLVGLDLDRLAGVVRADAEFLRLSRAAGRGQGDDPQRRRQPQTRARDPGSAQWRHHLRLPGKSTTLTPPEKTRRFPSSARWKARASKRPNGP